MESSVQPHLKVLNDCLENEASFSKDLVAQALQALSNLVAEVTDIDSAKLLIESVLLGLVNFIKELRKRTSVENEIVSATFALMETLLFDFDGICQNHFKSIYDLFNTCIFWANILEIRLHSSLLVKKLVEHESCQSMPDSLARYKKLFDQILMKTESAPSSTEKKVIFQLMSSIIKHFPQVLMNLKDQRKVFRKLECDIASLIKKDKGITELEGILECMNSFLFHFFDNMNEDTSYSLYLSIKKICEEAKSRRTSAREALKLIGHHFELFSKRIMEDYSWWHFVIRDYLRSPNKDDYIVAFEICDLYYRKVAELLSNVPCQISNSGPVLDFFTAELKKYLLSFEKREVSVALKNIGYFAPACKLHDKLAVIKDLFREMAEIVEKFSLGFEEDFDVHLSADMLISLTNMAKNLEGHTADKEESSLEVLMKLSRYVIVSYPKVPSRFQISVKRALVRSFTQIANINEYFFITFLDQVVFVCLIQTCSHLTENDVTLLKELGASDKEMTSYKNFVPLWRDLCNLRNVDYLETIPDCERIEFGRHKVDQRIFDSFMKGTLRILEKLDLSVVEGGMLQEPLLNSDTLPEIELKNESDYIILNNLIELFSIIVENCEFEMLKPSIPLLTKKFVEYATINPIKGGFFHLLTALFKKSGPSFCFDEDSDVNHLLHSFFVDILVRVDEFHGPELITCLRMMINAPMSIVKTVILSRISTLFKAVFDIGREDIVLALDGLKSLENIYSKIPLQDFEIVLLSVIPHLRYYLETSHFIGETDSLTKREEDFVASALTKSKDNPLKKYYKYITSSSANVDLSTLQEEIVKFLSTVDAKYCVSLYTPHICTFTESYNYLKFDIPFGDMKVNVFLDKFLPRTMEIACNSSDLKTRIVACEFLHSVITIFVANSNFTLTYPKEIRQLFNDLVSCSLKLGCDINSVVKQMFLPLCKQITRYCASRPLTDSPGTKILLNILFNGISDKTDNALRHLCAKLIRIFVQWSFKQTKIDIRRHRIPVNVEAVIQKICFFCVLPCAYNKLGAALAFINIYDVLKGDFNVLNEFWAEILIALVKNLFSSVERDCNNEITRKALRFIGRILRENSGILLRENDRRRIPQPLTSTRIPELFVTIFQYSVSKNKHCRYACMKLISDLSLAAGYESLQSFFESFPSTRNTVLDYYFECLRVDLDVAVFEIDTTVEKLEQLLAYLQTSTSGLHGLEWSLREKIINFDSINADSRFWISLKFFCEKVVLQNFNECVSNPVHVPVREDTAFVSDLASVRDQVFLEYLKILSFSGNHFDAFVGDELFQINLWKKFVSCLFSQTAESVDGNSSESNKSALLSILHYFKNCSDPKMNSVYAQINDSLNSCKLWVTLENFKNESELIARFNEQPYLYGAIMLQNVGILSSLMEDIDFEQRKIFNHVFEALNADYSAVSYSSSTGVISFLENVLNFCLPVVDEETVFNFIFDENPVTCRRQTAEMTRGRHFFSTFEKLFASYISEHQQFLVSQNMFSLNDLSKQKIQIILDCLSHSLNFDDFICAVYGQWSAPGLLDEQNATLESYLFDFIQQTCKRYKSCSKFDSECQLKVLQWLLQRLAHSDCPVLKKERIIRLLPAFVMQHEDVSKPEMFQFVMREFKKQYLDLTGQCILSQTEFMLLFTALLTLLRESQNATVLQLVIKFRAFNSKGDCDEGIEESLRALMRQQSSDYQLHVINVVYNIIRNDNSDFREEFVVDVVNLFLIPCLQIASSDSVINFFSAEFHFLIQSLKSTEQNLTSGEEKTEIIRQICAIRLMETYCDCVRNLDCPVVTLALYPNGENTLRKELVKLLRSAIQKKASLLDATNSSIFRQMKCFAYNTLIKIIKKIQNEEKFYALLFIESHRDKIWKHLVDSSEIKLSMVPEQISTRKKNFKRKKVKKKSNAVHSLPSQYLSTSSLVEDIVKYDFSGWTQTDSSFENIAAYDTIDLEEEILNQHECMVPLCDLLRFLVDKKISPPPNLETDVNPQMRPWMELLHASLEFYLKEKNKNVIMFLIRLVYNCEDIFMPYASNWIDLIVKCLIFLDDVNYFTSDVITMLTFTWRDRCVPKAELANNLFKLLLKKIDGNPTIRNYQLDLIGAIIDSWHSVLNANFTFLQPQLKDETVKEINLRIAKRFLLHAVFPFSRENRVEYLKNLLILTRSNLGKKTTQLTFEVLALILRTAESDSTVLNAAESAELQEKLTTSLTWLTSTNATRADLFYSSLDHVVVYYPQIVDRFSSYLLNNFKKLQGVFKIKCLKILAKTSEHLDDVFALLIRPELITCLQTNEYDLQIQALAVLSVAVPKFQDDDVNKFLPILAKLSSHPSAKCRRATYEILNSILLTYYYRFEDESEKIKSHCKTILLNGLLDRDSSLQQEMFNSWKSRLNLNEEVANRFMKIISEMYSPSNESQFVSYAVDFLLDASSSVSDYEANIYETPLMSNDEFQEYHILRGSSSTHSILPEFSSSVSHRMRLLTQNSNFSSLSLRLHSPQSDFVFQPSLHSGTFLPKRAGSSNSDVGQAVESPPSEMQYEKDKLRRRLFRNQGEATDFFASIQVGRKQRRKTLIAQKYVKVNQKITFCRKYRDGYFPDIQIPRSAVIIPLQMLAKRDITFAKIVLVNILEEILSKIPNKKDYLYRVNDIFNKMLKSSYKHDRVFVETLMEIAFFHSNDISLDSNILAIASQSSGLFSLGTLLLENSILKINLGGEEPVPKKLKTDHNLNDSWTQLADLYSALNESDVVNGILQEKVSSSTSSVMKEGLAYEQAGNVAAAMETYKKGLKNFVQQTTKSYDQHFITEAFFKCANYLSMFDEINNYIADQFEDLDALWKDNWDIEHTLPWLFTSEAYLRVEGDQEFGLLDSVLDPWLEDKNRCSLLTNLVAEQMAVLFVCLQQNSKASLIVKDCLKFLINDWNSSRISLNHFHRLQILSEINTMIEILNDSNDDVDVRIYNLLKTWKHCIPGKNAINFWDRRIMNRTLFIQKFSSELPIDDELREQLTDSRIVLKFHVLENAVDRGNYEMACKYFTSLHNKEFLTGDEDEIVIPDKFSNRFYLNLSKICMLKKESGTKVEDLFRCLDFLETGKINSGFEYFAHLAEVMSKILEHSNLFFVNGNIEEKLISQLRRILNKPDLKTENLLNEVSVYGVLENLEKSATLASHENRSQNEISSIYLNMAKYCRKFVDNEPGNLIYEENLTRSLLKALKFGSKEAQILFPTLLHLSHITNDSVKEVFLSESDKIEEWKFLPWVHQLLAYVSTDFVCLIENILRKIVERYPNSLQFTLYSTIKNVNCSSLETRKLIDDLQQKVDPHKKILKLIETFSHIRSPDSFFDHWLTQLWKITKRSNMLGELDALEEQLMQAVGSRGELFTTHPLLRSFNECIGKLKKNAENKNLVDAAVLQLKSAISENQNKPLSDRHELLELYSPACAQFTDWYGDNIEIPGQYDGFSVPVPEKHVKMYSFHQRVKVQISKQKPIKVKIIGNDAKKYAYLVKFEDDMRQDQRIQQIFSLINQCSSSSDDANSKNVGVITYGVYPLEADFGIIEWVEKTTTLKEFLDYGLSSDEKIRRRKIRSDLINEYHNSLREQFVSHSFCSEMEVVYEEAAKKYNKNFVVSSFQRWCREIPEEVFRNALLVLGNSPSIFWSLRNTFMRAYSTMCIYGWMLGIGDRHLKNTLVCLKTGNCIGIDFGYAFEAGVECTRIPELIPFRMTPHIQSIMAPMYLTGLIRETMIATLKKFRENEQVLVAALQIFILEPAFNYYWFNSAKKRLEGNENVEELRCYPTQKIDTIRSKLLGTNPALILIDEIQKNQVINSNYKAALIKLVSERNHSAESNLVVSAQVDQLLTLATDEGILGISWCGMETYI